MDNIIEKIKTFLRQKKEQNNLRILQKEINRTINRPISSIMTTKVLTVNKKASILEAARIMRDESVSCLVVRSEAKVEGLITESDFVRKVQLSSIGLAKPLAQAMSEDILCASEDTSIFEAHRLMTTNQFRKLPVLRDGKLVGIVTQTDIVKALDRFATHSIIDTLNSLHVWEIMKSPIVSVRPSDSVLNANKLMSDNRISCVFVADSETIKGIITEKDIVVEVAKDTGRLNRFRAQDIMKVPVVSIEPSLQLFEANHYMLEKGFRRFLVKAEKGPAVITQTDIARSAYSFLHNLLQRIEQKQIKELSIENIR